jgi:hypothetical protein
VFVVAYDLIGGPGVEHAEPRKTVREPEYVVDEIIVIWRWPTPFEPLS